MDAATLHGPDGRHAAVTTSCIASLQVVSHASEIITDLGSVFTHGKFVRVKSETTE